MSNLEKIDHIIVLMLENRSFDHLLGYLTLSGRKDIDGIKPSNTNEYGGQLHKPFHLKKTWTWPDPGHDVADVTEQLSDGNAGFVSNYAQHASPERARGVMGYYDATDVPAYHYLASNYLVCNRWFASVPGPTWPNRLTALTGDDGSREKYPYGMKTIFDSLQSSDWRYYFHDVPFLVAFGTRLVSDYIRNVSPVSAFFEQAREGRLPSVSWIDPNFGDIPLHGNDDHPPADIGLGQRLVARVYNSLIANEALWKKSLLIVTYDEHGGFYDHVAPPRTDLGVRVPTILVSPWVEKGKADTDLVLDHTSIASTIHKRFCPGAEFLNDRVRNATDLESLLKMDTARDDAFPAPVKNVDFFKRLWTTALLLRKRLPFRDAAVAIEQEDPEIRSAKLQAETLRQVEWAQEGDEVVLLTATPALEQMILESAQGFTEIDRAGASGYRDEEPEDSPPDELLTRGELLSFVEPTDLQVQLRDSSARSRAIGLR